MSHLGRIVYSLARLKLHSVNYQPAAFIVGSSKHFHTSPINRLKEVHEEEKNGEIVIKGVNVKSPREDYVLQTTNTKTEGGCSDCPICKLGPGIFIRHTDVLILSQFVSSDGRQLPRDVTGLCKHQHRRMNYLIVMARHAGLLPKRLPDGSIDPRESEGWKAYNKYYDDEGIDEFFDTKRKKL
jgi:ribosomal protein S18